MLLEDGTPVELSGEDLDVRIQEREGTASAYDEHALVALDTTLSDSLVREGLAREVVNRIQGLRMEADLPYDARISVSWDADSELASAIQEHELFVAAEVLASSFERRDGLSGSFSDTIRGEHLTLEIETL